MRETEQNKKGRNQVGYQNDTKMCKNPEGSRTAHDFNVARRGAAPALEFALLFSPSMVSSRPDEPSTWQRRLPQLTSPINRLLHGVERALH